MTDERRAGNSKLVWDKEKQAIIQTGSAEAYENLLRLRDRDEAKLRDELSRLTAENKEKDATIAELQQIIWDAEEADVEVVPAPGALEAENKAMREALKRLIAKYVNCARAHGNDDETINDSCRFATDALALSLDTTKTSGSVK
jgi:hypothetical protein